MFKPIIFTMYNHLWAFFRLPEYYLEYNYKWQLLDQPSHQSTQAATEVNKFISIKKINMNKKHICVPYLY